MNYGKAVVDKNFCGIPVMKEDISLDGKDFYCNMNKNTNYVNRDYEVCFNFNIEKILVLIRIS